MAAAHNLELTFTFACNQVLPIIYSGQTQTEYIAGLKAIGLPWEADANLKDPARPIWIVKPATRGEGKGIFLAETVEQLNSGTLYGKDKTRQTYIVQPLMKNPYLVNGHKFDLRCYVMVVSYQPLQAVFFGEGLVRSVGCIALLLLHLLVLVFVGLLLLSTQSSSPNHAPNLNLKLRQWSLLAPFPDCFDNHLLFFMCGATKCSSKLTSAPRRRPLPPPQVCRNKVFQ